MAIWTYKDLAVMIRFISGSGRSFGFRGLKTFRGNHNKGKMIGKPQRHRTAPFLGSHGIGQIVFHVIVRELVENFGIEIGGIGAFAPKRFSVHSLRIGFNPDSAYIIQRHGMIQRLINPRRFDNAERLLIEQTGITIGFEFVEDALGKLLVIAFVTEIFRERIERRYRRP